MHMDEKTLRPTYYVHNTSRDPKKKDQRLHNVGPDRSRLNIRIAGTLEVRRGRPLQIGDVILRRHLKELIELERLGLIEVYDYRSQRVDLTALPPAEAAVGPNKAKAEEKAARRAAADVPPNPMKESGVTRRILDPQPVEPSPEAEEPILSREEPVTVVDVPKPAETVVVEEAIVAPTTGNEDPRPDDDFGGAQSFGRKKRR